VGIGVVLKGIILLLIVALGQHYRLGFGEKSRAIERLTMEELRAIETG